MGLKRYGLLSSYLRNSINVSVLTISAQKDYAVDFYLKGSIRKSLVEAAALVKTDGVKCDRCSQCSLSGLPAP